MHLLYKEWLCAKLPLKVAAQRAMCEMLRQRRWPLPGPAYAPAQWAPFILVGRVGTEPDGVKRER